MAKNRQAALPAKKKPVTKAAPSKAVSDARKKLRGFLSDNPSASIQEVVRDDVTFLRVSDPWGDSSLALRIPEPIDKFAAALNKVRLPRRLSAIWHKDSHDLEIIWTAHNLPKRQVEVSKRSFNITFRGNTHLCEFSDSSERLLVIAEQMNPITMSHSDWRNLQSFSQYARLPKERHINFGLDKPRSFWIRNAEYSEDKLIDFMDHLNFYMTYYDSRSPVVLVHEPIDSNDKALQKTRYLHGDFPKQISMGSLDSHMLSFWNSAYDAEPMMSFLLYFRIIEYAATHFIDSSTRAQLRKLLMAPNLQTNIPATVDGIVGSMHLTKLDDTQRFKAVLRQCLDPALLWKDVQPNLPFFSRDTEFDGGFTVKKLVSEKDAEANFSTRGVESFAESARKIRNALSHGKDQETAGVITPSTRNVKLFVPWVHLIATAAGEVVLYKDAA